MADVVKKSIKDEMNSTVSCIPAKWNRFTVADGDWMQAKTLDQLMNRDDFLADKIGEGNSGWKDDLSSESAARYYEDQYLSASISSLSGEFYTFSANDYLPTVTSISSLLNYEINRATQAEDNLSGRISIEETARSAADAKLQKQIDELQAATDVIAVFGTYDEFVAGSGDLGVTDNDTIKVLRDYNYTPSASDEDYKSNDDDGFQVYYEWHDPNAENPHTDWIGWSAIGSLDPYYSVSEIDEYKKQIDSNFDSLSATVSSNYLSANENAIGAGKNIQIIYDENKPKITINTKSDVEFTTVSSTNISSTNVTALTATGNSAKFTNLSSTNLNNVAISNLFNSAYSGAEASAYITSHSADFLNSSHSAYGKLTFGNKEYLATNFSYNFKFNAGQEINFTTGDNQVTIGVTDNLITSANAGSAASAWINSKNSTIAFTTNFNGSNNVITGYGTSSFSAGESYIDGNYIHIDTSNNSINLASSISSTNISANSSFLSTVSGISAKFDNISATNVSSINITANSLSGNNTKFTDISATNITGVYLSSTNISAKNISGLDNINADSGFFNYLRSETLQGVTSSIDVDELISAVSSITGESNIYVRKDELECEIGSANSAIKQSFAQGKSNSANENSFVQGNSNTAGDDSFAQGDSNSANIRALAQGYSNTAYYESFAQGQINRVSNYSIGQGQGNSATNCSIAQGIHNDASNSAQAFGSNLIIESAMAIGKFNKTSSDAVFVIGNGTADSERNDLMVVDNSGAITLINYPYNDNQVDKIIISTTGVSGMYDHTRGGIELTGEYSSEWSNICNIENKYVPLSALKCDIGSNNSASDDDLVFMQGMHNYASNNSLTQGSDNSAIYYSLAQGYRNLASSNSIAVGTNNTAYNNSQSFGQEAYASAGGMAINPHYWGSTSPTKAINNSFAIGKECVANDDSLAFGQNNTASNLSVAFGFGISANDNQYIYGKYPSIGSNTVFAIGNGSADNYRSNYVSINKYGTLYLKNTVNNANKSVIINGHDRYIRSEENCRNIPFLLTSGYSLTSTITGSLLSTPDINTETLLLYGNDSDYLNMWVPTGTSGNKFKIMKVASMGTYKISIGIQAGYDMIFKNFSSGTTLASRKKIQTDNTKTSWPTPQQGTNISTSAKSFYFSAESNTTCVQFTEIPGHDDIDVIVDSLGQHFIMIKNHSEV